MRPRPRLNAKRNGSPAIILLACGAACGYFQRRDDDTTQSATTTRLRAHPGIAPSGEIRGANAPHFPTVLTRHIAPLKVRIMIEITCEGPADGPLIETLLDIAFGPERHARPSYALRDGIARASELCFVARQNDELVGTIRFWPLRIPGARRGLLLGPIAVHPDYGSLGIGGRLISESLNAARAHGHDAVAAIGAAHYLSRFGFRPAHEFSLQFPAEIARDRFLALELTPGALDQAGGLITKASGN